MCRFIADFHSLQSLTLRECPWDLTKNGAMAGILVSTFLSPVLSSITALSTFNNLYISFDRISSDRLKLSHVEKYLLTDDLKQALEQLPKLSHFRLMFEKFSVSKSLRPVEVESAFTRWLPKLANIVSVECECPYLIFNICLSDLGILSSHDVVCICIAT